MWTFSGSQITDDSIHYHYTKKRETEIEPQFKKIQLFPNTDKVLDPENIFLREHVYMWERTLRSNFYLTLVWRGRKWKVFPSYASF